MGSAFSMSWGDGGTPTTLGHLLGGFAEDSVARTSGVLGARRENLAGGGGRKPLSSAVCWVIAGLCS